LAGTWVGCEDPFIRIYAGTSGGNEMAAPKWGIFMSKVYADKKLGYGKIKEFDKPAVSSNEELSADADLSSIFKQGDSTSVDEGNGDANDFTNDPMTDQTPQEKIPIESEIQKSAADTNSKQKNKPEAKVILPPAIKPLTDNEKKLIKKEKAKAANEY
jgi:hypothetical protein